MRDYAIYTLPHRERCMDPERWEQIDDLVDAALELPEQDRAAFLKVACGDDIALREEVESLVAHAGAASSFLETPAALATTPPTPNSSDDETPTRTLPVARQHQAPDQGVDLVSGQIFGPYRIERLLGQGGMGKVYLAEERDTGRRVALKILNRGSLTPADRMRFLREGRLAASLSHEHVVYIFGTNEVEGTPIIVMELAAGGTLKDRVQTGGPLEPAHAVDAILQVIAGLRAAGAIGILHRDIKPSNCFVDSRGGVKIGDFGLSISTLARTDMTLTDSGTFMATPAFAAPERLKGETLDVRSDIYAVGATLYYLLAGRLPIEDTNFVRMVARIGQETPPSPRAFQPVVPAGLAAIVLRCLAKDPANRFETYADLSTALAAFSSLASPPARIGPRLVAGLIDYFLIIVVSSAASSFLLQPFVRAWAIFPVVTPPWAPALTVFAILVAALKALVCLAYFGVLEGIGSRSLGKRACGIRVAASDGGSAGTLNLLARALLFAVCGIVDTLASPQFPEFLNTRMSATVCGVAIFQVVVRDAANGSTFTYGSPGRLPVAFLLMFVSARRSNGYAGLHDLCTRTRVVYERADRTPAVSSLTQPRVYVPAGAPRLGPFVMLTPSDPMAPKGLVAGYDVDLARHVWIERLDPETPAILPGRRDLDRPARLRWLTGIRRDDQAWDAYEAVPGQPLMSLPTQPWSLVRDWVRDIAIELSAGLNDGSLPRLSLDHVWIGRDGRVRLLDWAAAGTGRSDRDLDLDAAPADCKDAQWFLLQCAASVLDVRPASDARREPPRTQPPLPLSAATFFRTLAEGAFTDGRAMADGAASLVHQPAAISSWRRTSHLAVCAVLSLFVAGPLLGWVELRTSVSADGPADGDVRWLTQSLNELSLHDGWAQQSPTPVIVERRQALEIYIAGTLRQRLQDALQSTDLATRPLPNGLLGARAEELLRKPVPSAEEVTRAEKVLERWLASMNRGVSSEQAARRRISLAGVLALIVAIVGSILSPLLFRGGMLLRSLRFALVTADGIETSRARALCRAVVAWMPAYLYLVMAAQQSDLLTPLQRSSYLFASITPVGLPLSGTAVIGLAVFIGGGLVAAVRPTRGIQDWLARTWLVPR